MDSRPTLVDPDNDPWLWLEKGGTTVIANIRGGGEFGTRWHEAGPRERKALSHDDFAAFLRRSIGWDI